VHASGLRDNEVLGPLAIRQSYYSFYLLVFQLTKGCRIYLIVLEEAKNPLIVRLSKSAVKLRLAIIY